MLRAEVVSREGSLPHVSWRWEPETDILSGSCRRPASGQRAEAVELSGPDGAVVVLDVVDQELCGLDIVIWPDVETIAELVPPAPSTEGWVRLALATGAPSEELELALRVDGPERTFHLRFGPPRAARVVRVADHFLVEVDADGLVAGCWLTHVPPFPSEE